MADPESIGQYLRTLREEKGLSLEDVEQATKIRMHHLRAIESDQIADRIASTYAKAFIKTYADFLGADGNALAEQFKNLQQDAPPEPKVPRAARTSQGITRYISREMLLVSVSGMAILLLAVVIFCCRAYLFWPYKVTVGAHGRVPIKVYCDGRFVWGSTIESGETKSWRGKKSVKLKISRPENAQVFYKGRRIQLPAGASVTILFDRHTANGRIISRSVRPIRRGT